MRGVFDRDGKAFKCDVEGNDKNYGVNVVNEESKEVYVFEGAIDLMSFFDIHRDLKANLLALGMTADAPLVTFLKEHKQITDIKFCLDNDEPGRKATKELLKKYYELGYEVENTPPPKDFKDVNAWLVHCKGKTQACDEKVIPLWQIYKNIGVLGVSPNKKHFV